MNNMYGMYGNRSVEEKNKYVISDPYPTVITERNTNWARLLYNDFGGNIGELTAIAQYEFQNFVLCDTDSELAKGLHEIAKVEMLHLSLLGKTISKLGGIPMFVNYNNNRRNYWNSGCINYRTDIRNMLESNIKVEQITIQNFRKHAKVIENESIRALLNRIIIDEELHIKVFEDFLKNC